MTENEKKILLLIGCCMLVFGLGVVEIIGTVQFYQLYNSSDCMMWLAIGGSAIINIFTWSTIFCFNSKSVGCFSMWVIVRTAVWVLIIVNLFIKKYDCTDALYSINILEISIVLEIIYCATVLIAFIIRTFTWLTDKTTRRYAPIEV